MVVKRGERIKLKHKNMCDVIKHNESEVSQIQFSFFWLIVYIIWKAAFHKRSIEIGQMVPKIQVVVKTIGNKEIICFVWLFLKISIRLILLDYVTFKCVYKKKIFYGKKILIEKFQMKRLVKQLIEMESIEFYDQYW